MPAGQLWLRVPAHDCIYEASRLMPAPLIAADEFGPSGALPVEADHISQGDAPVDFIIDDGPARYGEPATVILVKDSSWSVLRPGVVRESTIGRLASEVFLFVCTGNTCRSPLAEGFFRKLLADRLKCTEDELTDRGYMVLSAGLAAEVGSPASPDSVVIAKRFGVDLRSHSSQPVSDRLLEQADRIFAMTRSHREAILAMHPHLDSRVELLARDKTDISDPIGAGMAEYEACQVEIEKHLRALLGSLEI